MGELFRLTTGPTRVTTTDAQNIKEVQQVTAYKGFDLLLQVYELSGTVLSLTVKVETSMQNLSSDAVLWQPLGTFTAVTSANKTEALSITSGVLQYVRFYVTLGVNTSSATFDITGIARPG